MLDSNDETFIQQAARFCNVIDKYSHMLHLNEKDVATLKGDVNIVMYISSRYPSFTPSFVQYNIKTLRNRFAEMSAACLRSTHYNHYLGVELGLEVTGVETHVPAEMIGSWFLGVLRRSPNF
jgi:hypothetical protein